MNSVITMVTVREPLKGTTVCFYAPSLQCWYEIDTIRVHHIEIWECKDYAHKRLVATIPTTCLVEFAYNDEA